jgi:cytoskeletal protein RodZ
MPKVNSAILRWARETSGLSLRDAASKIDLREARGVSPEDRLKALEQGQVAPTRPLLLKMAKQY